MASEGTRKLINVGPKSAAWLRQVGIRTEDELRELGSVAAFLKVKRAGFRPSLNLLYALEGALLGCHWQQLPDNRRGELLIEVDAAEVSTPLPKGRAAGPVIDRSGEHDDRDHEDRDDVPDGSGIDEPVDATRE